MRHNDCTGPGCERCALYDADPEFRAAWWRVIGGVHTARPAAPCVHLGGDTGRKVKCPSCTGHVLLKVFSCAVYGRCTQGKVAAGLACCTNDCPGRLSESAT